LKKSFFILFLVGVFYSSIILAQNKFVIAEKSLKIMGDSILNGTTDSIRTLNCTAFNLKFEELLRDSASFYYSFDSLKNVSILSSKDKKIRIFTWMLPAVQKDKYRYFGFVQTIDKKSKKVNLFKLQEENLSSEEAENTVLTVKNWFGALYYKMLENKIGSNKAFTLLGWRGNNRQTTMKLIDVLIIDNGVLKFGSPVFKTEHGLKHRVVFEYTAQAVMSLRYNEKKKMIVFDHLSPSNPDLKGKYEYYGPDMSCDAFKFKSGKWNFFKNIEIGNPGEYDVKSKKQEVKHKEFYNPNQ
jgi:hypothetical protein